MATYRKHWSKDRPYRREDQLTAREVAKFLEEVPPQAKVTPISSDIGNQRDPWMVFVGLSAEWED